MYIASDTQFLRVQQMSMICRYEHFVVKHESAGVDGERASLLASGYSVLCLGGGTSRDSSQVSLSGQT